MQPSGSIQIVGSTVPLIAPVDCAAAIPGTLTDSAATSAAVVKDLKQGLKTRITALPPFSNLPSFRGRGSADRKSLFVCSTLSTRADFGSLKMAPCLAKATTR